MKKGKIILALAIVCLALCGCGNGQNTSSYGDEENPYTTPSLEKAEEILNQELSDGTTYLIRDLRGKAYADITFTKNDADSNTEKLVQSILIRTQVLKENENVTTKEETPQNKNVTYSTKDNLVIDELNTTIDTINKEKRGTSFTESAKSTFITLVDFIFYDGTIKGVTFDELTESGKQKVLELASKIDNSLEEKSPGYKDKISDTAGKVLNKASEIIKDNATNMDNFARESLGEENYQALIDASQKFKEKSKDALNFVQDSGSKILNSTKDKLDKWYKNFKNNN